MKFRQDALKFGISLFIGLCLAEFLMKGNIATNSLVGNAVGAIIGGLIYAWWTNRKTKHEIFRKKK